MLLRFLLTLIFALILSLVIGLILAMKEQPYSKDLWYVIEHLKALLYMVAIVPAASYTKLRPGTQSMNGEPAMRLRAGFLRTTERREI